MQTLPDSNYRTYSIPGYPQNTGLLQESPTFGQGEDVLLGLSLRIDGQPVDETEYDLEVIVKKSTYASNILWKGLLNFGLYRRLIDEAWTPGSYYMLMPAAVSGLFLPGTYYVDVKATQKPGSGNLTKDLTLFILSSTFNIVLSAASPNPKLTPSSGVETVLDPEDRTITLTWSSVEPTLPQSTDITSI